MIRQRIATVLTATLVAAALSMTAAQAGRGGGGGGGGGGHGSHGGGHSGGGSHTGNHGHGGHGHGGYGHGHGGFVAGIGFGSLWWPWTYPVGPVVYDAPVWLPASGIDPQYEPATPVPPAEYWWYYCVDSGTYYPYVQTCASPWQRVVPTPSQ